LPIRMARVEGRFGGLSNYGIWPANNWEIDWFLSEQSWYGVDWRIDVVLPGRWGRAVTRIFWIGGKVELFRVTATSVLHG